MVLEAVFRGRRRLVCNVPDVSGERDRKGGSSQIGVFLKVYGLEREFAQTLATILV